MEKFDNATLYIGLTTRYGTALNEEAVINSIGTMTDCTIIESIGFYKGTKEKSLKVEIFNISNDDARMLASRLAYLFMQECVAVKMDSDKKVRFETGDRYYDWFQENA